MSKRVKILLGVLVVVLLAGIIVTFGSGDLFQGRMGKSISRTPNAAQCTMAHENFDPNPNVNVKKMDPIEFKWNGPGCSKYDFTQYLLCFENVLNATEFACIGNDSPTNNRTLSVEDWELIDGEMKTTNRYGKVGMYWYVDSHFGNAYKGEHLQTEGWKINYKK